ncbi:ABC transporter substrate-binding protein [Nonomuraea dietziae]|uniref:ABC transporter substrate-binding protein n=1 Tax=Nonomuraea dietziae TaxID=65515 RepID=UPI0033DF1FB8
MRRLALAVAAALVLTACGATAEAPSPQEAKTLTLWHYEGPDSAMAKAWAEAIKKFEATHPGVKVKFEEKGFEAMQKTASQVLNSDAAPDLTEYNKGNATAGALAKAGLLTDLSAEAAERGWDKLLTGSLQATARYDERGIMGSGNWYGVPNYGEFVMVYYNKKLFEKAGLEVPTTFEEFTKVMDAFVAKDQTPLAMAGAEYPAQQVFYQLALSKAQRPWVNAYQLYQGKTDFKGPELAYAAQTMADWVKKGYISKDAAGLKAQDMGDAFMAGKFPMMVSGSWWYGTVQSTVKDFEWGTFLWPGSRMAPGSSGNLWVVPERAKNKELAYDFIDITMSKEIQNLLGNSGGIPVAADTSAITDPKSKELIENFGRLAGQDGLAFYPDWPAPGYYDVLVAGVQELINATKTPEQVLDELAGPYNDNLADVGN